MPNNLVVEILNDIKEKSEVKYWSLFILGYSISIKSSLFELKNIIIKLLENYEPFFFCFNDDLNPILIEEK